jgi:hypothetical protein
MLELWMERLKHIDLFSGLGGFALACHGKSNGEWQTKINKLLEGRMLMTPQAGDGEFCTPRTSGRAMDKQTHLATQIAMLPTPQNRDWKGQSQRGQYQGDALPNAIVFQDGQKTEYGDLQSSRLISPADLFCE